MGKTVYVESVKNADLKKMAKLIRIMGMLLQLKVYLFWPNKAFPLVKTKTFGMTS
jgi:hypothetical protein